MAFVCSMGSTSRPGSRSAEGPVSQSTRNHPDFPDTVAWQHHKFSKHLVWRSEPSLASGQNPETIPLASKPAVFLDGYLADRVAIEQSLSSRLVGPKRNDAELIADLVTQKGIQALDWLTGTFFLCLIDPEGTVTIQRDRLGGRTGYFRIVDGVVLVGSRASLLARASRPSAVPDESFLASCFSLSVKPPPGATAYQGVEELLPGQQVRFSPSGAIEKRRPLPEPVSDLDAPMPDLAARFRDLLQDAVLACLPDERGTAAMVSGGMDSGPMAVLADSLLDRSGNNVIPIAWSLPGQRRSDETRWIEQLGQALSCPPEFFDGSDLLPFDRIDEGDSSPEIPLYNPFRALINRCYALAADHGCNVILNGNAGDLLYPPRTIAYLDTIAREGLREACSDIAWVVRHYGTRTLFRDPAFRHLIGRVSGLRPTRRAARAVFHQRMPWLTQHARQLLVESDWPPEAEHHRHPAWYRQVFGQTMAFGRAHEAAFPNRFGVDRRDPYQNEALARFITAIPVRSVHYQDQTKHIAREAARGLIPESIRTKRRTGVLDQAFNAGLARNREKVRMFLETHTGWQRYIRTDWLNRALDKERAGAHDQLLICQAIGFELWQKNLP